MVDIDIETFRHMQILKIFFTCSHSFVCFTLTVLSVYYISLRKFATYFYTYVLSHLILRPNVRSPLPLTTSLEARNEICSQCHWAQLQNGLSFSGAIVKG